MLSYESKDKSENLLSTGQELVQEAMPAYRTDRQGSFNLKDYRCLPDDIRAELIDGYLIVMDAPSVTHQNLIAELLVEFALFIRSNHGSCKVLPAPLDVRLDCDDKTMVQPDIVISCDMEKRTDRELLGAPDMCIEIVSDSTRSRDYGLKMMKYMNAGVREYWIVDAKREVITCYNFESEDSPAVYTFQDKVPVRIFAGLLRIDFAAIEKRLYNGQ